MDAMRSSQSRKLPMKPAEICCTSIIGQGCSGFSRCSRVFNAAGPPAEAAMPTILGMSVDFGDNRLEAVDGLRPALRLLRLTTLTWDMTRNVLSSSSRSEEHTSELQSRENV